MSPETLAGQKGWLHDDATPGSSCRFTQPAQSFAGDVSPPLGAWLDRMGATWDCLPATSDSGTLEAAATAAGVTPESLVRGVLLENAEGTVLLAVLPQTHLIDFGRLQALTGLAAMPADPDTVRRTFREARPGTAPPVGAAWSLPTILDASIERIPMVFFESGSGRTLIRMSGEDFCRVQGEGVRRGSFARSAPEGAGNGSRVVIEPADLVGLTPPEEMRARLTKVYALPAMPQMVAQLLDLHRNPESSIRELSAIVGADPSLAAQIMRHAGSAYFGYRGKVDSIDDAVTRVLGYDFTLHMALGVAAGRSFRNPVDGPLGLNAFWEHALHAAALAQRLARHVDASLRPKPGLAWLAGLLHDFGFLVLGHLFPPEFFLLNRLVAAHPDLPVGVIERQLIGFGEARQVLAMGHGELGALLMEHWQMPSGIVTAIRHHHDASYRGEDWVHPALVRVVEGLLQACKGGDGDAGEPCGSLLEDLGLSAEVAQSEREALLGESASMTATARQMAA